MAVSFEVRRIGDPGVTRTRNILLRRQVLYPVELRGRLKQFGARFALILQSDNRFNLLQDLVVSQFEIS